MADPSKVFSRVPTTLNSLGDCVSPNCNGEATTPTRTVQIYPFQFGMKAKCLDVCDDKVVLAGPIDGNTPNVQEILVLAMPYALLCLPNEIQGLVNPYFTIVGGITFNGPPVIQIKFVPDQDALLTLHADGEVSLWGSNSLSTRMTKLATCHLNSPPKDLFILFSSHAVVSLESEFRILSIDLDEDDAEIRVEPFQCYHNDIVDAKPLDKFPWYVTLDRGGDLWIHNLKETRSMICLSNIGPTHVVSSSCMKLNAFGKHIFVSILHENNVVTLKWIKFRLKQIKSPGGKREEEMVHCESISINSNHIDLRCKSVIKSLIWGNVDNGESFHNRPDLIATSETEILILRLADSFDRTGRIEELLRLQLHESGTHICKQHPSLDKVFFSTNKGQHLVGWSYY